MQFGRFEIFNRSNDSIYSNYYDIVIKVFDNYKFLGLNQKEIEKIIIDEIKLSRTTYDYKETYGIYLRNQISKTLNLFVKDLLEKDGTRAITIDKMLADKDISTFLSIVVTYNEFSNLINKIGVKIDNTFIEDVLKNSKIIKKTIIYLYERYKVLIINTDINNFIKNNFLASCLKKYIIINNKYHKDNKYKNTEVENYLKEVFSYPHLNKETERKLAIKMKNGDKNAKDILITSNLRYVVYIANSIFNKYGNDNIQVFLDMIEEGTLGFMKCIDNYDCTKNYLQNYIGYPIRNSIIEYLLSNELPVGIKATRFFKVLDYHKEYIKLKEELEREPRIEEIAKYIDVSDKIIKKYKNCIYDMICLHEDRSTLECDLDDSYYKEQLQARLNNLFKYLNFPDEYIYVINHRFELNGCPRKTLDEIGADLNKSKERIRQIEIIATEKILKNKNKIDDYLGLASPTIDINQRLRDIQIIDIKTPQIEEVVEDQEITSNNHKESKNIYDYYYKSKKELENTRIQVNMFLHEEIIYNNEEIDYYNLPKYTPINDDLTISKKDYKVALILLDTPYIRYLFNKLNNTEALIILFKYGFIEGKRFSNKAIAKFLNLQNDEIEYILDYGISNSKLMLNENNELIIKESYCKKLSK